MSFGNHIFFTVLPGIIIITDGVTSVPDVAVCETLLNQLRSGTITCSFVQVCSGKSSQEGQQLQN